MARATIQPVRNAATQVITTVTTATKIDGIPNRATCDNASTSLVVRETRSPVPARSTVDSGSETTRSMNCSRSSAKRSSPIRNDDRRANHVSTVWATTATARPTARRSTVSSAPCWVTVSTSRPTIRGAASAAAAANACRLTTRTSWPRCRSSMPLVCVRTEDISATGSVARVGGVMRNAISPPLGSRRPGRPGWCAAARGGYRGPSRSRPAGTARGRPGRAAAGWRS